MNTRPLREKSGIEYQYLILGTGRSELANVLIRPIFFPVTVIFDTSIYYKDKIIRLLKKLQLITVKK